jgi:hypothetical protein
LEGKMTITAAHRPPDRLQADGRGRSGTDEHADDAIRGIGDDPPNPVEDGVIFEAKRRARRRRIGFGVAAGVTTLALGTGIMIAFGGPAETDDAVRSGSGGASGSIAASSQGAEVVAGWNRIHVGWVYIYGDGRVLWHPDQVNGIVEQRLSPVGVQLVRTGEIQPVEFVILGEIPAEAWADATPTEYQPSEYAVCHLGTTPSQDAVGDVSAIQTRLPAAVGAIVAGTERSYAADPDDRVGYRPSAGPGGGCFVLDADDTALVWTRTRARSGSGDADGELRRSDATFATITANDGTELTLTAVPILPHGGFVLWGG